MAAPLTNPPAAQRLTERFQSIAETRMANLPLCNPALRVESVGFRCWRGGTIGVLVTPWSMSLIYIPGSRTDWANARPGASATLSLPSGDYAFLVAAEPTLGTYLTSSLVSIMFEISNMTEARAVAQAVMTELFADGPAPRSGSDALVPSPPKSMDRRRFLGAWLPGSSGD